MTTEKYVLTLAVLGRTPESVITKAEYEEMKRCHKHVYESFEIELAFDFVVLNYLDIEKYIAAHLVNDMVGRLREYDDFRSLQWGFMRVFSNWLASVTFWQDLTRHRLISICGRNSELDGFSAAHKKIVEDEFEYALILQLRNYSQHVGFPISGFSSGGAWNEEGTELTYTSKYNIRYDHVRDYFEQGGKNARERRQFGERFKAFSGGKPIDIKPIIRRSMGVLGSFMDQTRVLMATQVSSNEQSVLDMIRRYRSEHPGVDSILGLSVMPVDANGVVENRADIRPVRNEFVFRARSLRKKNSANTLNVEKRVTSSV